MWCVVMFVILVKDKKKTIYKNKRLMLSLTTFMGNGFHLAVACDIFDGVLFCAVLFPTKCLELDLELY